MVRSGHAGWFVVKGETTRTLVDGIHVQKYISGGPSVKGGGGY